MALIDNLIQALQVLPGVGPKSAQRMALALLQRNRSGGTQLGNVLLQAMEAVQRCSVCQNLTETEVCRVCRPQARCVSSGRTPADVLAIEQRAVVIHFVLHGRLSPIDGSGQSNLDWIVCRLAFSSSARRIYSNQPLKARPTHFISRMIADDVKQVSRMSCHWAAS